ncbi:response regulator [Rossellomorea aquimaris]|uniref:response regulator n=1 Tax=Rossellomorea aquimaris TaxID=189382 RepID=UPI0007D08D4E|nr:response regulator [Rossellomorea aquimaris]
MDKYQQLFIQKIKSTLLNWQEREYISSPELYRLLHSIRGTASTIGLVDFSNIADELLGYLDENSRSTWEKEKWKKFTLPLLSFFENQGQMENDKSNEISTRNNTSKLMVLIDENTSTLTHGKCLFESDGWVVYVVNNSEEISQKLKDHHPDCIVIDFHTFKNKQINIENIKKEAYHSITPIFLINGPDSSTFRKQAYSSGIVDYLQSSIDDEELFIRINNKITIVEQYQLQSYKDPAGTIKKRNRLSKSTTKVLHIGIIDDDPVIQQVLKDYFNRFSFDGFSIDIRTFREGESFFTDEWFKQEGNFIILLDGIMPRMDGYEVLKRIRRDFPHRNVMIIMLTARKNEKDIIKALELGADDYLTKPFNIRELEARVRRLAMRMI